MNDPVTPQTVNPNYPMPAPGLTGGQKFEWLALGFLSGITGILVAYLTNTDKAQPVRSSAIKFALIGLAINIVLVILLFMSVGCTTAATLGALYNY